jgi:glycerophosphoryl diester phosphodiesterase
MPISPLLLGHRGVRRQKSTPENTAAAFDLALEAGCDGVEFDVRLSSDGHAVLCHDARIRGVDIAQTSAEQLRLPLLADILRRYQNSAFLDIELKVPGLEAITLDLLRKHPPARGYVVSSFLPDVLKTIRELNAATPLGLICESEPQLGLWSSLLVQYVIPHHKLMRRRLIAELQKNGRKVIVWTVNSITDMKKFATWGADGLVSDKPEVLVRTLRGKNTL